MPGPRRFRQCPRCGVVLAAGKFTSTFGANYQKDKPAERTCPECGHKAVTTEFTVVEVQSVKELN